MGRETRSARALLRAGVDFHGHLGPHLVLGLRIGLAAIRLLNPKRLHELSVTVWTGTSPPRSCLLDGIQVSSGCTLGKGNIRTIDSQHTKARFRQGNHTLIIDPTDNAKALLSRLAKPQPEQELTKTAMALYRMPDRELFTVTRKEFTS